MNRSGAGLEMSGSDHGGGFISQTELMIESSLHIAYVLDVPKEQIRSKNLSRKRNNQRAHRSSVKLGERCPQQQARACVCACAYTPRMRNDRSPFPEKHVYERSVAFPYNARIRI